MRVKIFATRKKSFLTQEWINICKDNHFIPTGLCTLNADTVLRLFINRIPVNIIYLNEIISNGFNARYFNYVVELHTQDVKTPTVHKFNTIMGIIKFFDQITTRVNEMTDQKPAEPKSAIVNPSHYDVMFEKAIDIIARSMTPPQFYGFCLGNVMKYRLRAGKKDALEQDIKKADYYEKLYDEKVHLCIKE